MLSESGRSAEITYEKALHTISVLTAERDALKAQNDSLAKELKAVNDVVEANLNQELSDELARYGFSEEQTSKMGIDEKQTIVKVARVTAASKKPNVHFVPDSERDEDEGLTVGSLFKFGGDK
jgi:FtsZ-binding cell division protein ZapB